MPHQKNAKERELKVKVSFEACRVTSKCLADAYEQIVPVHRRITRTGGQPVRDNSGSTGLPKPADGSYDYVPNSLERRKIS